MACSACLLIELRATSPGMADQQCDKRTNEQKPQKLPSTPSIQALRTHLYGFHCPMLQVPG